MIVVLVVAALTLRAVLASSNPFVVQVASPDMQDGETGANSKAALGFMEDIGFDNFFQDVGVEAAASVPGFARVQPAGSNHFPSFGFGFSSPGEATKEQLAAMKEQGFMPTNPFGSATNLAASNIAPSHSFSDDRNPFSASSFKFPLLQPDFGFSFGSTDDKGQVPAKKEKERAGSAFREDAPRRHPSSSQSAPKFAQRRHDQFNRDDFDSPLYASSSQNEEKKNKGTCKIEHKDGMTCEVCNDGHGGFSEHCSHSQHSGKDTKFTNSRRQTTDDVLPPHKSQAQGHQDQARQQPQHGGGHRPEQAQSFDHSTHSAPRSNAPANVLQHHEPSQCAPNRPGNQQYYQQNYPQVHQSPQQQPRQNHHVTHTNQPQFQQNPYPHNNPDVHHQEPVPSRVLRQEHSRLDTSLTSSGHSHTRPNHENVYQPQLQTSVPQGLVNQQTYQQSAPPNQPLHQSFQQVPVVHHHVQPQTKGLHQAHGSNQQQPNPNNHLVQQIPGSRVLNHNEQSQSPFYRVSLDPTQTNHPVAQQPGERSAFLQIQVQPQLNQQAEQQNLHQARQMDDKPGHLTVYQAPNHHHSSSHQKLSLNQLPQNSRRQDTYSSHNPAVQSSVHSTETNQGTQENRHSEQPKSLQTSEKLPPNYPQSPGETHSVNIESNVYIKNDDEKQKPQRYINEENPKNIIPTSHHSQTYNSLPVQQKETPDQNRLFVPVVSEQITEHVPNISINEISHHGKHEKQEGIVDRKYENDGRKHTHNDGKTAGRDDGNTGERDDESSTGLDEGSAGTRDDESGRDDESTGGHDDYDFDFDFGFDHRFGGSPYAQSRRDAVYDRRPEPVRGFYSNPFDHFAAGTNSDPYKFDIPKFDGVDFEFGPEKHDKLVKEVGLHDKSKQSTNSDAKRVTKSQPHLTSSSQQNKVAEQNLGYTPDKNLEELGKMVNEFGKKNRQNCKKEIRKSMTCYICPNKHGKSDEECMFANNDPHSQHMMYTEESSYGNVPLEE